MFKPGTGGRGGGGPGRNCARTDRHKDSFTIGSGSPREILRNKHGGWPGGAARTHGVSLLCDPHTPVILFYFVRFNFILSVCFRLFPFFFLLTLRITPSQQQPPSSPAKIMGVIRTERDFIERLKA